MNNYSITKSNKKKSTALILCILFGYWGVHYFYTGKKGMGFLYLFTMGLGGIGWFIDIFRILFGTFRDCNGLLLSGFEFPQYNAQVRPLDIPQQTQPSLASKSYDLMDGHEFEYYCAELLRKNGYEDVEVTQGSGDHGIDILAVKDDISYAIQCKCYSSNIGNSAVQQAHTGKSLYGKDIAVVLTNRYFTAQAKQEAAALGVKLWDRDKLDAMNIRQ